MKHPSHVWDGARTCARCGVDILWPQIKFQCVNAAPAPVVEDKPAVVIDWFEMIRSGTSS